VLAGMLLNRSLDWLLRLRESFICFRLLDGWSQRATASNDFIHEGAIEQSGRYTHNPIRIKILDIRGMSVCFHGCDHSHFRSI